VIVLVKTKSRNVYYNPNPLKKKTGDCVVRAICKATGEDWDAVFGKLCMLGLEFKSMPNSDTCWKTYLERNGFIKHSISVKKGSKRPTVESFAKDNPSGTYILRVANHIVTCHDGKYYDTWDSGDKSLYGYWEKNNLIK
jgi:hypothetical protein